jgi:hypothetical protein
MMGVKHHGGGRPTSAVYGYLNDVRLKYALRGCLLQRQVWPHPEKVKR